MIATGRLSGGVAMYVRDEIACSTEIVFSYETDPVQMICLYSQPENLLLITIYRRPDDSAHGHPSKSADFKKALNRLKNTIPKFNPIPDIIIGGDFNLPYTTWHVGRCKP